jgi:hypothetical protein
MVDNDIIQDLGHFDVLQRRSDTSVRILQLTDMHLFPTADKEWVVEAKAGKIVDFEKDGACLQSAPCYHADMNDAEIPVPACTICL